MTTKRSTTKRRVFAISAILCLVAALSAGSLAWFTDTDEVTNTFQVASSDDPDKIFSVKVTESEPMPGEGDVWTATGSPEEGYTYESVLPGDQLPKDPTIANTGSYDAWMRAHVTLSRYSVWSGIAAAYGFNLLNLVEGFDATLWNTSEEPVVDATADTITYTIYYLAPFAVGDTATVFTGVSLPGELTVQDMIDLGTFDLSVSADIIQRANTGDSAVEAFANCWPKA